MKYKNIKSFGHNFLHSFFSYDGEAGFVEEFKQIVRDLKGKKLRINWIPYSIENFDFNETMKSRIEQYLKVLPDLAGSQNVDIEFLTKFYVEVSRKENHQLAVRAVLIDDRGKEYSIESYL